MKKAPAQDEMAVTVGSDNVFADLGVSNPEEAAVKADLASQITAMLQERGILDDQAAIRAILGIDQPKVSKLLRGRLSEFSEQRLVKFIRLLGADVDIVIHRPKTRKSPSRPGHLHVVRA